MLSWVKDKRWSENRNILVRRKVTLLEIGLRGADPQDCAATTGGNAMLQGLSDMTQPWALYRDRAQDRPVGYRTDLLDRFMPSGRS